MFSKNPAAKYAVRHDKRQQMFHSSGYAVAQNGQNLGAAGGESFAERRAIDERRKYVRGYNNARIINDAYAFERVRRYIPRTGGMSDAGADASNRGATGGARGATSASAAAKTGAEAPANSPLARSATGATSRTRGAAGQTSAHATTVGRRPSPGNFAPARATRSVQTGARRG